jgi:acetyltransferase-like isoleucine patch superfamily enzyme
MTPKTLPHDWFPRPLPENIDLGSGTWLYSSFAFLHFTSTRPRAVRTGRSCGIYSHCFFDLGPEGAVEIGDYTTLVDVIVSSNNQVRIGSYCFLAHEVVIADQHAQVPPSATKEQLSEDRRRPIVLEDDTWVGMGAVLLSGARIGKGSVIGARAVVDFAVPPFSVVAGSPARVVGSSR